MKKKKTNKFSKDLRSILESFVKDSKGKKVKGLHIISLRIKNVKSR